MDWFDCICRLDEIVDSLARMGFDEDTEALKAISDDMKSRTVLTLKDDPPALADAEQGEPER